MCLESVFEIIYTVKIILQKKLLKNNRNLTKK